MTLVFLKSGFHSRAVHCHILAVCLLSLLIFPGLGGCSSSPPVGSESSATGEEHKKSQVPSRLPPAQKIGQGDDMNTTAQQAPSPALSGQLPSEADKKNDLKRAQDSIAEFESFFNEKISSLEADIQKLRKEYQDMKKLPLMSGDMTEAQKKIDSIAASFDKLEQEFAAHEGIMEISLRLKFHRQILSLLKDINELCESTGKMNNRNEFMLPEKIQKTDSAILQLKKDISEARSSIGKYLNAENDSQLEEPFKVCLARLDEKEKKLKQAEDIMTQIKKGLQEIVKKNQSRSDRSELMHKSVTEICHSAETLLQEFLRKNGKETLRKFFKDRYSAIITLMLGNMSGIRTLLVGGLASDEWTNTVVNLFAKSEVAGERLVIIKIHRLPKLKEKNTPPDFLEKFKPALYRKKTLERKLVDEIGKWIKDSDLSISLGDEMEGGSSIYYAVRSIKVIQSQLQGALDKIQKDREFNSTLNRNCESVVPLRSDNPNSRFESFVLHTSKSYPKKKIFDVRVCDNFSQVKRENHQKQISQARILLNHLLGHFSVIQTPVKAMSDADSLVNIRDLTPDIVVEMKYATTDNFLKRKMYQAGECYLQKDVAMKLMKAQKYLEKEKPGFHLKCLDCYRPLSVQKAMWQILPDARYVANPKKGSRHNRGISVDVTLTDAKEKELEMPTAFDDFSKKAGSGYDKIPKKPKQNRELLKKVMKKAGFTGIRTEWWHYDGASPKDYPLMSDSLTDLE